MVVEPVLFVLVLILGMTISKYFSVAAKDTKRLRLLWLYHLVFGLVVCYTSLKDSGSDSVKYWREASHLTATEAWTNLFTSRGTYAMYSLNYIPAAVFGLSFFMLTVIYALWGFIGFCFFYRIAEDIIPHNSKLKSIYIFPTILFLPSLHFWSAGVGKDTLLFTCIGAFIYAMMNLQRRYMLLAITIGLSLLVRPHITLFLFMSFAAAYLFNTRIHVYKRVLLSLFLVGVCIALIPKLMEYAKLEELSLDSYNQFAQEKALILSRGNVGSRIDMSSYPLPLKVFTFLYRPLPFDVHNMAALMAAIENMILLYLSYLAIRRGPVYTFKRAPFIVKGMFFLLFIGATMSSLSLGNLGIMIRMRNMFLPSLLIYILWSLSFQTQRALTVKKSNLPEPDVTT